MIYRKLGRTGVEVSAFCLGTMMFGEWGNRDVDDCVRIIHAALDAGINFVDTADVYSQGGAEEIVAKALKGRRDDVVLATKVHGQMGEGRNRSGNSRLWITKEVEHSLTRLDTDYIDLYQLHRPDPSTDIAETLGALTDLVRAGKVRYIGCSTFPASEIVEAHWASERNRFARFACEQPPYSILVRGIERDVLAVTQRYGMGVIAWSPLAGGWLSGKYRRGAEIPEDSRAVRIGSYNRALAARFDLSLPVNQRKQDLVAELELVAEKAGMPLTHMANAFVLAHPGVTASIIGPRTMDQLLDLLEGADVTLEADTLDAIDEIVPPGTVVNDVDRGWTPPWMRADARRR